MVAAISVSLEHENIVFAGEIIPKWAQITGRYNKQEHCEAFKYVIKSLLAQELVD